MSSAVSTLSTISTQSGVSRSRHPGTTVEPSGELRLTGRGRVVLTVLMLVILLAGLVAFSGFSAATGSDGVPVRTRTVVVDQGDTLWRIAGRFAGPEDVREVVHDIEQLNGLPGPELVVGQKLAVPLG